MGNFSGHVEKIKNFFPCYRRRQELFKSGETPLHEAVKFGNEEKVLKLLKKKGVDVNVANKDGFTPVHYAVKYGQPKLIKILMDRGGDINKPGFHGLRPFHMLMVSHSRYKCLEVILRYKPDIDAKEILGNTILQIMVMIAPTSTEVIMMLLEHGSNPNNLNIVGNNCLHNIAMLERHVSEYRTKILAQALLRKGLDPNCKNKAGNTPLHFAARGNQTLAGILIEGGADINLANEENVTAFDVATKKNDKDIIQHFIKNVVLRQHRGLKVKESIVKKTQSTEFYRNIVSRYENEMLVLKMMKIYSQSKITYYDILCNRRIRRRVVMNVGLYRHVNCDKVKYLSYKNDFLSVVNAEIRLQDHEEEAYKIVDVFVGDKLPHLCVEKIASFLEPKDLENLRCLMHPPLGKI